MQYAKENQDNEDIRYRESFFFQDATSKMTTRRLYNRLVPFTKLAKMFLFLLFPETDGAGPRTHSAFLHSTEGYTFKSPLC
jgi:hypothetical protein